MKYSIVILLLLSLPFANRSFGEEANSVSFRRDIAPLLRDSCLACHGAKKAEGGYRVDTFEQLLKAGDSGEPPIATSSDQLGEFLRRIVCEDESERMPAESDPLTEVQIELFKRWIDSGAKFDGGDTKKTLALVIPPVRHADAPEAYSQAIPITATTFSPDGKLLVVGGYHELTIWDVASSKLVRRINDIGQRVLALTFSPDGKTLAVGCGSPGRSGEVRLVNFETGVIKGVVSRTHDVVMDLAYRPGGKLLAIASADSTIRLVDIETLDLVRTIASHADWVTAVAWSDDGSRLASASRDKSVKVYDGETGNLIHSYLGHGAAVRGVAVLAGSEQVVSVGDDKKLHRWAIDGGKRVAQVAIGGDGYKLIRHESSLFLPCSDKRLLRIDLDTNSVAQEYTGHADWVLSASLQPISESETSRGLIATGSFDGEVRLWNAVDSALVSAWIAKP